MAQIGMTAREFLIEMAVHLYDIGKMTMGQARKFAGLDQIAFQNAIKDKLKHYSKKQGKIHQSTITRYFQERLLFRLSISVYKKKFLLKGGALIYCFQKEASRPTLDIE